MSQSLDSGCWGSVNFMSPPEVTSAFFWGKLPASVSDPENRTFSCQR